MEGIPTRRLNRGMRYLRHINRLIAQLPRPPGMANEDRLVEILRTYLEHARHRPPWLLKVAPASLRQDHQGIDVVVTTDSGPLFLQVKSSEALKCAFEVDRNRRWKSGKRLLNIRTVVVNDTLADGAVIHAALRELHKLRTLVQRHGTFLPPKREPD